MRWAEVSNILKELVFSLHLPLYKEYPKTYFKMTLNLAKIHNINFKTINRIITLFFYICNLTIFVNYRFNDKVPYYETKQHSEEIKKHQINQNNTYKGFQNIKLFQ